MIGTATESVARLLASEGDKEPLGLGEMFAPQELPLDSDLSVAVADELRALVPAAPELEWPSTDGLFLVRWGSTFRGQRGSSRTGEEVVGATGGDWMELTFDAVNRCTGVNGLENDATWELRDSQAVIRIWTGRREVVAFVEEME